MVEATQESTKIANGFDYDDPKGRNWSWSWASNGIAWRPAIWKNLDAVINWSEIMDIKPGFDLKVFSGSAPDQFQTEYIDFGFTSRIIEIMVVGHGVDIILSRQNMDILISFSVQGVYVDAIAASAFKIKTSIAGYNAIYQIVPIN